MEIYSNTGVLKSGTLRVTKSIGALAFITSRALAAFTNEKITAYIERSNGSNEEIATNIPLSAFIAGSLFGEGQMTVDGTGKFLSFCEIGNEGSLKLGENESLVIQLTDLIAGEFYAINGIEMPVDALERIYVTEKIMLAGQKSRAFDVEQFDELTILGAFDKIRMTYQTDEGSRVVEYTQAECEIINQDMTVLVAGTNTNPADFTPLSVVGVVSVEIFAANQVSLVLRDVNIPY